MWVKYMLLLCMVLLIELGKTADYGHIGQYPSNSYFYGILPEKRTHSNTDPEVQNYNINLQTLTSNSMELYQPMEPVTVPHDRQTKPERGRRVKPGRGRRNKQGRRRRNKQGRRRRNKKGRGRRNKPRRGQQGKPRRGRPAKPGRGQKVKPSDKKNGCSHPGISCGIHGVCWTACLANERICPDNQCDGLNCKCCIPNTDIVPRDCNTPAPDGLSIEKIEEHLYNNIDPQNIRKFLRHMTLRPHLGGTEGELELSRWVADTWRQQGMDHVHLVPYHVLLSYPSKRYPNVVRILDGYGSLIWQSEVKQKPLYAPEEALPEIPFNFNAYGHSGSVIGDIVYAGFGRKSEFDYLESIGIPVVGRIVLVRYGKTFRANTAWLAESRGAIGVIFYSDPQDYAPSTPDDVYPRSVLMPPSAAPAGIVHMAKLKDGDHLNPFYPATEGAFYITEDEVGFPEIPIQPINYNDAWVLLSHLGGPKAPPEWQGGLNITYHLGPKLHNRGWRVNLEVHNSNEPTITHNVVGVIRGAQEPDRYVILGNHIDAWFLGAMDPSSGTAALMELARAMLKLKKETGWRPRRSIVFVTWGSEEYGTIGSTEWTEQFGKQLADRALAYLNVEMAIEGNYTLMMRSAPLLYDMIYEATKKIPNPDPAEVEAGRLTVYDTWALRRPDPKNPQLPWMQLIGAATDYTSFQHNLGIPCIDFRYTHSKYTIGEPMYHTLYDTFEVVDELYDRGFHFQKAIAVLWGYLALNLADSLVIPFSLEKYANFINTGYDDILETYGEIIAAQNITMKYFQNACQNFNQSVKHFRKRHAKLNTQCPLAVRHMNDQLMMVERSFIDPRGLPGRPDYNHIVTAPAARDDYSGTAFAGLTDALVTITNPGEDDPEDLSEVWRTFRHHLSAVTHLIDTAAKVLTDDLW